MQIGILPSFIMPIGGLSLQILGAHLRPQAQVADGSKNKAAGDAPNPTNSNNLILTGKTIQRWGAHLFLLSGALRFAMRDDVPLAVAMGTGSLALFAAGDLHYLWKHWEANSNDDSWGKTAGWMSDNSQAVVDFAVKGLNLYPMAVHGFRLYNMSGPGGQIVAGSLLTIGGVEALAAIILDPPKV
jgi:hypothetical protein